MQLFLYKNAKKSRYKNSSVFKAVVLFELQKRTAENYRKREGEKDIKVKPVAAPRYDAFDDINALTDKSENEKTQKVFLSVSRVKTSLTDEEGENGHRYSADYTEGIHMRKKHESHMVNKHRQTSYKLKMVSVQNKTSFRFNCYYNILFRFLFQAIPNKKGCRK